MKKLLFLFILLSGTLFGQVDTSKKYDIVCYKSGNSFYLYVMKNSGIYYYNFSSRELSDFKQMFWKESKSFPMDTTMVEAYETKRLGIKDLNERMEKELK